MVQSYEDLKSYQQQKRIMLVLSDQLCDMVVNMATNPTEGRNRPAYAWITGRLQVIAYAQIPQICRAMYRSYLRIFDKWRRINTPFIQHFPMTYDEMRLHSCFKMAMYNNEQNYKQRIVQRLSNTGVDLNLPKWRRMGEALFPADVRKTLDDFYEVELTRIDNLDHALPLADRLRPPRQRIYPLVLD